MIKLIAELLTFYIPNKKLRKKVRTQIMSWYYGFQVYQKAEKIGKNFVVSRYSVVTKRTKIGDNVIFNGVEVSGVGHVQIGNYCQFGSGILIVSSNHDYDNGESIPYGAYSIDKGIIIEDFVWCGSNSIILTGSEIGEGAIIQVGSVVHGKIPPYSIVGGNPAKVFKYRNIEHFKNLKEQKRFLEHV